MPTEVKGGWHTEYVARRLWCLAIVCQVRRCGWHDGWRIAWTRTESRLVWRVRL